jgi:CheY-like chemotaxis protein
MHGGSVSASSPGKGKGSTFKTLLPVTSRHRWGKRKKQPGSSETKTHKLDGKRVLIVEDDGDTLDLLRSILERSGATVAIAASTKEALAVLERWEPHVLLSDIAMPEQDGYELIAKVRSREHGRNLPAVAVTAYGGPKTGSGLWPPDSRITSLNLSTPKS